MPVECNVRWKAPEMMDELPDGSLPSPTFQSDAYSTASVMYEVGCCFSSDVIWCRFFLLGPDWSCSLLRGQARDYCRI